MQAFFIEMIDGHNQLTFVPDSVSVAVHGSDNQFRSSEEETISNLLKFQLEMGDHRNTALVAVLPEASDLYDPKEDIYKLFSFEESVPEIYTISEGQAIEVNAVSQNGIAKTIPLGIKTNREEEFRISWEGANDFTAFDHVLLKDVVTRQEYDLRNTTGLTFEKTSPEDIEGRFYLVMNNDILTGTVETSNENLIRVFSQAGTVTVSSSLHEIQGLALYDIPGRLQYQDNSLTTLYHHFNPNVDPGVFILKVTTSSGQKICKIRIK
jgi:hypothetical protein